MANTTTIYNSAVSAVNAPTLGALEDPEFLIACLVGIFARRNSFAANVDALGDVTPNVWNTQLNEACHTLEENLLSDFELNERALHEGSFAYALRDKLKSALHK